MKSPTPEAQCAEGVSQIQSINNPGQDQREGETLCFIFISFHISKSFILNFFGTNNGLSNKSTKPMYFESHTVCL